MILISQHLLRVFRHPFSEFSVSKFHLKDRMKNIITLLILFVTSMSGFSQNLSDQIIGTWDADKANVEIYKADDNFIGNPIVDGKRNEKVEMLNLVYEEGKWVGKLYNKKRDKLMDVVCTVKDDVLLLEVDAGFTTKKIEWIKVK